MEWASLVDIISSLINNYGIEILSSLVLGYLGIQSGFVGFIVKWILSKAADYLKKFLQRKAAKQDQKNINEKNSEELQKVIDSPTASESDVIKAGADLLNGVKVGKKKT